MNGIKCYDSSGARMKYLYQWDAEQVIKICGIDADIEPEVQFCSIDSEEALVVPHSIDGADIVANVPNLLLQRPVPIMVYVCHSPKDGASRTIGAARITVVQKAKPVDYVYTETEVLNYRTLDAQMTELRNSIELLEDKMPTVLPNPHPLTINGQSYDGSNPVNISVESNTQGGGAVSSDEIKLAIASYMSEHPISFEEADPTVPAWAKQPTKPAYTAQEVGALPSDTTIPKVLPNPNALTFTGAVSCNYDGSTPLSVNIPSDSGSSERAVTIFDTTIAEVVKRISYTLAEADKEYTNFLIIVYPVDTATYEGTGHQYTFRIYYSNSENAYTQKKSNLNNPVGRPLANEFYWNSELELGRLSHTSDYTFIKNVSTSDKVVMLAVDADFPEKWIEGTRVVIKAWRDNL